MPEICTGPVLSSFLWTGKGLNMGSLLLIVVNLYSYKDSDVRNLHKFEFFTIILDIRVTREIQFN